MLEVRDPRLMTSVHDFRAFAPEDIRFGMRHADAVSAAEGGTRVADFTRIGELERRRTLGTGVDRAGTREGLDALAKSIDVPCASALDGRRILRRPHEKGGIHDRWA